jgi:hypothetical protein
MLQSGKFKPIFWGPVWAHLLNHQYTYILSEFEAQERM